MTNPRDLSGFVVGVDAGGTSTRAVAMNAAGEILGRGTSGPANPSSTPVEIVAQHISEAIRTALSEMNPAHTRACVIGMAGVNLMGKPENRQVFDLTLAQLELACPIQLSHDAEVAFSSATKAKTGTALIAGTGSIAIEISNRKIDSIIGGGGWLLGDEGSAFWLGREAVRATLFALRDQRELAELTHEVLVGVTGENNFDYSTKDARLALRRDLTNFVYGQAPIQLARFAPLVSDYARKNDPIALDIIDRAVDLLSENVLAVRKANDDGPVVLIGSVIAQGTPAGVKLQQKLSTLDFLESPGGELGAAWLAAIEVYGEDVPHPAR